MGDWGTCLDVSQILHNGHWPFSPLLKSLPSLTTAAPTAPAAFGSPPSAISTLSKCPQKCPHSKNVPESHFPSLPILQLGLFNSKIHPRLPFRLFASLLEHFSGQFLPPALLAIKLSFCSFLKICFSSKSFFIFPSISNNFHPFSLKEHLRNN